MAHSSPITATSPTSCPAASWASTRGNSGPTGAGSVGQTRPGTTMSRWTMPTSPAFGRTRARLPRITGLILGLSLSSPAPAQLQGLMGAILVTQVSALTVSCLASEPLSQLPPPPPPAPPPPPPPPPGERIDTLFREDFESGSLNWDDSAGGPTHVVVRDGTLAYSGSHYLKIVYPLGVNGGGSLGQFLGAPGDTTAVLRLPLPNPR